MRVIVFCINFVKKYIEMNFLKLITLLIISPNEGWKDINKFTIPNKLLLAKLFYPSLALLAMSVFVPFIFGYISMNLHDVVISAMLNFIKYFISLFIIFYIISGIYIDKFKQKNESNKLNNFIALILTILVFFNILRNLMPGFPFFEIFPFYVIFVIYKGLFYLEIQRNEEVKFVVIMSTLVLLVPAGIKFVLELLIP